jgi:hypothetical protein
MSEKIYNGKPYNNMLDDKEMIFSNQNGGIQSGGLSIKSIMLSKGLSPIMSINTDINSSKTERVSDLFESLVIPYGLINNIKNTNYNYDIFENDKNIYDDNSNEKYDCDADDELGDLYDKLLKLVEPDKNEIFVDSKSNDLLFGGKKKNKSKKHKLIKNKGNSKSKKNTKIKIN